MIGRDCTLSACERTNLPHTSRGAGFYVLSQAGIAVAEMGAEGIYMTWTYSPANTWNDLITKPLLMAMLGSAFLGSLWGEVLTTRFEFKPVLTSYTALCNRSSQTELKWMHAICKADPRTETEVIAEVP